MDLDTLVVNLSKYEIVVLIKNLGIEYNTVKKYLVEKGFCDLIKSEKKLLGSEITWRDFYITDLTINQCYSIYNECLELIYGNEG